MDYAVKILKIENVTHNVRRFRLEKPPGYHFNPGQATDVSINKPEWKDEVRPFTFTSLNEDPNLEFTIKIYNDHEGVTNQLGKLKLNDELIIRDVWGAIEYKGPGYFIAGGAGITPFIAILRALYKKNSIGDNRLFFSNNTSNDIILREELTAMLGNKALYVITDEPDSQYYNGYINKEFLLKQITDFSKNIYLCGPPKMMEAVTGILEELGASPDRVVFEK